LAGDVTTWAWYLAVMVLGRFLFRAGPRSVARGAGVILGPTLFFVVSNYAVWVGGDMYPRTMGGLIGHATRRGSVLSQRRAFHWHRAGLAFGLPVLVRRMNRAHVVPSRPERVPISFGSLPASGRQDKIVAGEKPWRPRLREPAFRVEVYLSTSWSPTRNTWTG